jgi:L-ascorbate metabolism protein UlaG (beta-lactamase superfamily)
MAIGYKRLFLIASVVLLSASISRRVFGKPRPLNTKNDKDAGDRYQLTLPGLPQKEEGQVAGSVTFIGTATVIIRYGGLTILTDPNFLHKGDHVHLGYGLTSERLTNPAIQLGDLPPIDLIVLSHMHEDHFDRFVQKNLSRTIPIATTEESARILKRLGFLKLYPLRTWDTFLVEKGDITLRVTAMPGRHGPPVVAKLLPEVMGSMLDFRSRDSRGPYRMYISGDTMVFNDIRKIPQRYPSVDLALLHLGATRLLGLVTVTMDAKEGVRMMKIIVPRKAIPVHYNDYDVFKSPLGNFEREIKRAGLQDKIVYLEHGGKYEFGPIAE